MIKGSKHTAETRLKMSKNHGKYWLGKTREFTDEHKKNMTRWKGKKLTDEHKKNISKALKRWTKKRNENEK